MSIIRSNSERKWPWKINKNEISRVKWKGNILKLTRSTQNDVEKVGYILITVELELKIYICFFDRYFSY